jgi:hypothetical protein
MKEVVYQVSAHEYTPKQAAEEFARKWFDRPRQVERFADNRFSLVDGIAEYEVIRVPEVHLVSGPLWRIVRLLTPRAEDGVYCSCETPVLVDGRIRCGWCTLVIRPAADANR